jgi:membrane protein CcdC involved in cytochrome C biogenesis
MNAMNLVMVTSIGAVCMAVFAMFIRMKAAKKPASAKKILLPPLFMSTGALMYVLPQFRLTGYEILEAAAVGMLFSTLLIKTSKFEIKDQEIYLKRSRAFVFILVGLLVVRIVGKFILSSSIDYGQLSGMFFLLAFSMILPWRIAMYRNYQKLADELRGSVGPTSVI